VPDGLRASPTGRVPQWVVDEVAGRSPAGQPWRAWTPADTPRLPARRVRSRRGAVLAVLAALSLAMAATVFLQPDGTAADLGSPHPTPGAGSADSPLGTPSPAPGTGGTHAFVATQDNGADPVAYDPCRPVHYVVRPDHTPMGGEAVLTDAIARISEVTGLQFVFDGRTAEAPVSDRPVFQPDRYGDQWAPVLIAWGTVAEQPDFLTDVAGLAGSASVSTAAGERVFVTGTVQLDAAAFERILADPAGVPVARAIVLHELGHLVGLDHVPDPAQLMYPTQQAALDFGAGDLTGLHRLGTGACVPAI
jgi:hypothetical protein